MCLPLFSVASENEEKPQTEQKVFIYIANYRYSDDGDFKNIQKQIDPYLSKGWKVKIVSTAATASSRHSPMVYYVFVLEREI